MDILRVTSEPLINYLLAVIDGLVSLDLNSVAQGLQQSRINFQTPNGVSALTLAINSDKIGIPVLKLLLDAGFELNGTVNDGKGHTIIMKALLNGVTCDKIRYLVERGADIKFNSQEGNALHFAVKGGNIEVLEFLLNYGIDINARSSGISPIELAVEEYRLSVLRYLLKQKIQPPIINSTPEQKLVHPLHCIAIRKYIAAGLHSQDYFEILDLLLAASVDLNEKEGNYSPLTYAIMARKGDVILALLERGAKINDSVDLFSVCKGKWIEMLIKLIEHGANVKALSKKGKTLVHAVLANPNTSLSVYNENRFEEKLLAGPKIDAMLAVLANHGADFNHIDDDGVVPLMLAESLAHFRLLETYGADPSIKINGENLLHLLLENPNIEIYSWAARQLRGSVNEKDRDGLTPILHCISKFKTGQRYYNVNTIDFVRVLIENGADVDAVDTSGQSAMYYAVRKGDSELLELLLSHGASIFVRDKNGNNILHEIARSKRLAKYLFPSIVNYASRDQIFELLNGKNKKSYYPEDLAADKGIEHLFKEKIIAASKRGIDIFDYEKLFPSQIANLRNGFQLHQAEISYECMTDLQPANSFLHLPQEVVLTVMKFASVETVVALSSTCRQLKIWGDDDVLWRELLTREYDTCQSVKCQNVKQELAKKWNAQVNMRHGDYFVVCLNLDEDSSASCYMDYDAKHNLFAIITNDNLAVMDTKTLRVLFEVPSNNTHWELLLPRVRIFAKQKQIICAFGEKTAIINSETGEKEDIPGLPQFFDFDSDGELVAFDIAEGTIQVWNWVTKTIVWELKALEDWNEDPYRLKLVNGKLARTLLNQNLVQIWDIKTGSFVLDFEGRTFERLGKYIVISDDRKDWYYYDTESNNVIVRSIAVVADLKNKLMASLDRGEITIRKYDKETDRFKQMTTVVAKRVGNCKKIGALHENLLFTFTNDNEIEVWDAHSLNQLYSTHDLVCCHYPSMLVQDQFLFVNTSNGVAILNFNM